MGIRRKVGDLVVLAGEDTTCLGRIVAHGRGVEPDDCVLDCGDADCKEWPVVEVLDEFGGATGKRAFHVAECQMAVPAE